MLGTLKRKCERLKNRTSGQSRFIKTFRYSYRKRRKQKGYGWLNSRYPSRFRRRDIHRILSKSVRRRTSATNRPPWNNRVIIRVLDFSLGRWLTLDCGQSSTSLGIKTQTRKKRTSECNPSKYFRLMLKRKRHLAKLFHRLPRTTTLRNYFRRITLNLRSAINKKDFLQSTY